MLPDNDHTKKVFEHLEAALDAKASRFARYSNDGKDDLFVMELDDHPQTGVKTYSTVGLSRFPLMKNEKRSAVSLEIIGSCGSAFPDFNNLISASAFHVIFSKWYCCPGMIYPDVVSQCGISVTMNDVYFANPFLWDNKLHNLKVNSSTVAWLLAVPISRGESNYARKFGTDKLEELFEKEDIDIFNLNRQSVV